MKATLKQAAKILSLFEETPLEQIQELLASGILADVRDANISEVNRDEHRKFLGLVPLTFPTLTITVVPRKLEPPFQGWKLIENMESLVGTLTLGLGEFLESGESWVGGEVMRERAKKHNWLLGEIHARALLEQQDKIPAEWRKFFLVFPGTLWRQPGVGLGVPCLGWSGDRWCLRWDGLEDVWNSYDRFVRLRE